MPKVIGRVNRPPDFWSDKEFFSDYWWHDEKKLNTAVNKLEEEVKKNGKIKLYSLQEHSPKLQAVQALAGAKVTGMYDEKLLTRIEAAQTQYNTKSSNATEINAETFTALKKRFDKRQTFYKRHPKYKKFVALYFDKGKMDEMFYEVAVGVAGMKPLGKSVTEAKGVKSPKQKTELDAVDDIKRLNRKGESDVDFKIAAGEGEAVEGGSKGGNPGSYAPNRELPRTKHGDPIPDTDAPHTQLGQRTDNGITYNQGRTWESNPNGKGVTATKDYDFSDHGTPDIHPNPHQHPLTPANPKLAPKGGYHRGPAEPLE